MTLKELESIVLKSSSTDWKRIVCWGAYTGPSYKDRFDSPSESDNSHSEILVYRENISITMALGMECNGDYNAKWLVNSPDNKAHSEFVDIFYNNALVYRESYVVIDSGRSKLPIPSYNDKGNVVVRRDYYSFVKMLQRISSIDDSDFDYYFNQTNVEIID